MTNFRLENSRSGWLDFERRQQTCRDSLNALLTPDLQPLVSEQDAGFLQNKTVISEKVEQLKGDQTDLKSVIIIFTMESSSISRFTAMTRRKTRWLLRERF